MTTRLSPARLLALVIVIVAFVALSVFALFARAYQPGRPAVAGSAAARLTLLPPRTATPIAATSALPVAPRPAAAAPTPGAPAAAPTPLPPTGSPSTQQPSPLAPCALGLAVPTEQAGLANLTPLVPLFGPFSPEAFAMVPAFAPGFPLFGPLLIAGGNFLAANSAVTDAAYAVAHPLQTEGFNAIAPFYEPVRPQVLAGEAQLAALLAEQVAAFAGAPGATCLPAALALAPL